MLDEHADRDSYNLVHVGFHDRSAHQGHQFDDNFKSEMACLGKLFARQLILAKVGSQAKEVCCTPVLLDDMPQ